MGIKIKITEQEILEMPNDNQLGSYIRQKYMEKSNEKKEPKIDWLSLGQITNEEPEACLICGKLSPYVRSTHIDLRVGFVEGVGQGCFVPGKCLKNNE